MLFSHLQNVGDILFGQREELLCFFVMHEHFPLRQELSSVLLRTQRGLSKRGGAVWCLMVLSVVESGRFIALSKSNR